MGMAVGGVVGNTVSDIIKNMEATNDDEYEQCPSVNNTCPPCTPPVGTIRYRIDMVPPSQPHYPHTGSHVHLYERHQSPSPKCQCFWHPVGTTELPPPPNTSPM
jgi:hypothetical protein